ncbi:LPS export ABC transporter periplasmic protein LptC [bacterium]|nr:LPS export ABC transporter periplasmic protein LptC [bacterium]
MITRSHVKKILIICMIALLVIFGIYFFKSTLRPMNPEADTLQLDKDNPDWKIESFERTFQKNGKNCFFIKAHKIKGFLKENIYLLEQIEQATFWQDDGSTVQAQADEGIFEQNRNNITVTGNVAITITPADPTIAPLHFRSNDLKYDHESGLLSTDSSVTLIQGESTVSGTGLEMQRNNSALFLESAVRTEFYYHDEASGRAVPLEIRSARAEYFHDQQAIHYYEEVRVRSEESTIESDELHGYLDPAVNRIECLGRVRAELSPEVADGSGESLEKSGERVHIQAAELIIYRLTRLIRARGEVEVHRGDRLLRAEETELFYDQAERAIVAMYAQGNVHVEEIGRSLTADRVSYSILSDRLIATGEPRVESSTDFLRGDVMVMQPDMQLLTIRGNVHGSFQSNVIHTGEKKKGPARAGSSLLVGLTEGPVEFKARNGFFDQSQGLGLLEGKVIIRQLENTLATDKISFALNASRQIRDFDAMGHVQVSDPEQNMHCDRLTFSGQDRLAIATGNCKLWRDQSRIEAPVIHIFTEQEKVYAFNGVSTHLEGEFDPGQTQSADKGKMLTDGLFSQHPVDIHSETLWFLNKEAEAIFDGEVLIRRTGPNGLVSTMKSDNVRVVFADDSQGFQELTAVGHIEILMKEPDGDRRILGDRAGYRGGIDLLWVEGSRVRIIDSSNDITCTRADFFLSERRYIIEGRDATSIHYIQGDTRGKVDQTEEKPINNDKAFTQPGPTPSTGQQVPRSRILTQ